MSLDVSTTNSECPFTGDGLCDDEAVESAGPGTVREESCGFGELGDTGDTSVLFVQMC